MYHKVQKKTIFEGLLTTIAIRKEFHTELLLNGL